MYCRMNRVECSYADMNGYCDSTACHNMNLVGNIIPKERPENINIGDSSIWVKPQSNWHTGKPTDKVWYLVTSGGNNSASYDIGRWDGESFCYMEYLDSADVIAWQKIEPYKEKGDGIQTGM